MRFFLIFFTLYHMLTAQKPVRIDWTAQTEFTTFPERLGLAGIAAAKAEGGILMAGGANFPDLLPWEGGKKVYSDRIFLWDGSQKAPQQLSFKLPKPGGYYGYTSAGDKMLIAGGETTEGVSKEVFLISRDGLTLLPDLPAGVTAPVVIYHEEKIYLLGGDETGKTSRQFLVLNLLQREKGWQHLPDLPVATANAAAFFAQHSIYLAGGRSKNPNGISTLNSEIFKFDFKGGSWQKETPILVNGNISPFVAPAFFTFKDRYLIFAGGDDGKVFHQIETALHKISLAKSETEKDQLTREKNFMVKHHQGFNNKVLIYDTKTHHWLVEGFLPFPAQVTTASVAADGCFYIISGEVRPGIRSPKIIKGTIK